MVKDFSDFCAVLLQSGFSMGGGNAKGIYAVIPFDWEEQNLLDSPIRWHSGEADTDPWEWRMRVLEERSDIAYAKMFFRASGYITKEWYPLFYAVRRKGESFEDAYEGGTISQDEKRIYQLIAENGDMPLHEIKQRGGFQKEDKSRFERALTQLQTRMLLTMSGRMQKISQKGEGYGWNSTVFTTVEDFWRRRNVSLPELDPVLSYEKIKAQVLMLNPQADLKKVDQFIRG